MSKPYRWVSLVLFESVVLACMSSPSPAAQPVPPQPSTQVSTVAPAVVMKPGAYPQKIESGGNARQFILYVPRAYDGSQALPLVFVLHGYGGNAAGMVKTTGMSDKAEAEGFFVAYLNGTVVSDPVTGAPDRAWNSGITPEIGPNVDDVGFVRDVLKQLEGELRVDSRRVYAAGFSNGAFMSHRLGAELTDVLAGVAVVEGTIGETEADGTLVTIPVPTGPMSIIIFHGKQDKNVPYDGGVAPQGHHVNAASAADAVALWVQADGCTGVPQQQTSNDGNVIQHDYTSCAGGSEVLFDTIVNGEHEWPTLQGHTHFSATDAIWEFFSRHSLP